MAKTLYFDWDTHSFPIENGLPVTVDGEDAVKVWVRQMIMTNRGLKQIYPADYGTSVREMLHYRMPEGYVQSELNREIQESAAYNPYIETVSDISIDDGKVDFSVTLKEES